MEQILILSESIWENEETEIPVLLDFPNNQYLYLSLTSSGVTVMSYSHNLIIKPNKGDYPSHLVAENWLFDRSAEEGSFIVR